MSKLDLLLLDVSYLSCLSCSSSAGDIGGFSSLLSKEGVGLGLLPSLRAVELFLREWEPAAQNVILRHIIYVEIPAETVCN